MIPLPATARPALALALCAGLLAGTPLAASPTPVETDAAVPQHWPSGPAYTDAGTAAAPRYSYRDVLADPRLVALIDTGLAHNQDVALALANIAAARAQYRIQRAALMPQINAGGGWSHAEGEGTMLGGATVKGNAYLAEGSAAYELDLFGRVRSLTTAQRARYLASVEAARATRLTLVADIADAWLTYAADASLLTIARNTATAARASVALTTRRVEGGIAPLSDQRQAELTLHGAEADVAAQTTALARDVNALRLLTGAEVAPANLPADIADADTRLAALPAGLDSAVLLRRPDVAEAELSLRAAKANVGAARAGLFPKITLTGVAGVASTALSALFTGGAFAWGTNAAASWPIFNGGATKSAFRLAQAQRDASLAAYRKTIESAFRDVADTLARGGTIDAQLAATTAARDAAADNFRLADRRYQGGVTGWLESLTAQQALYAEEKALVSTRLAAASNRVALYRALGGDDPVAASPGN